MPDGLEGAPVNNIPQGTRKVGYKSPQCNGIYYNPTTLYSLPKKAPYFDAWKQKVERIGTLNYPDEARGKLYGKVVIFVELRAEDGSLYSAEISRSSGHKILDQAALRILRMSAPFGPIPREAMGGAAILSFAREWNFVPGDVFDTGKSNN